MKIPPVLPNFLLPLHPSSAHPHSSFADSLFSPRPLSTLLGEGGGTRLKEAVQVERGMSRTGLARVGGDRGRRGRLKKKDEKHKGILDLLAG